MKLNKSLTTSIACLVVIYFTTSFIVLEINFFNWDFTARLFTATIWVVILSIAFANNEINKL